MRRTWSSRPTGFVKILSPSTERIDRGLKLGVDAREKVPHAWLINPATRTLEVLKLQGKEWVIASVHSESETVRAEPFDAVELDLGGLWA